MNRFNRLVRMQSKLVRLGGQIIHHKKTIQKTPKDHLEREFEKQENRIQKYFKLSKEVQKKHDKYLQDIHAYWTGLS